MANDFDNDDLSWLRDQNSGDDDDAPSENDLPDFDWLDDEDGATTTGVSSTGLTGQLPWQRDRADDETSSDDRARLGVTGELDWRRTGSQQDIESLFDDSNSSSEWETADAAFNTSEVADDSVADSAPVADIGREDEVPDWLQDMLDDVEAVAEEPTVISTAPAATFDFEAADELDLPDDGDGEAEPEISSEPLPDWLQSAAPPSVPIISGTGTLAADADTSDDDPFAGLFDDMTLEADFDEAEFDLEDVPVPAAYAAAEMQTADEADDFDLFDALASTAEDEIGDSISPPEVFSPEGLQSLDDYSLIEALDAPENSETDTTVSDDFFSSLLEDDDEQEFDFDEAPPLERLPAALSADDDSLQWMNDLEAYDEIEQVPASSAQIDGVDDFLASLGSYDDSAPQRAVDHELMVPGDEIDFNRLLSDPAFNDFEAETDDFEDTFERPAPVPGSPEWLADVSIREVSASALVRQQQDRPLENLPSRLQALREEGLTLPAADALGQETTAPIFDPASPTVTVPQAESGQFALSPEQAQKVALLRTITHSDAEPVEARPQQVRRNRTLSQVGRVLSALLIGAAVLLPFVSNFRIGNLPPSSFETGSQSQTVFAAVDQLRPRELVLFAAEYGGANAGELDGLADVLLRHTLLRGAIPVVISSNPIGLLRMDRRLTEISDDILVRNRDYVIGRYIAGDDIGLRNLAQEITTLTATDFNGRATNLDITSLDDFAAIIVITGEVNGVRTWSEQIAPLTQAPLLFATSASVSPVAQPYAEAAGVSALLVGYGDTYTYADQLNALLDAGARPPLIEFETQTETPTPEQTEAVTPTETTVPATMSEEAGVIVTTVTAETAATEVVATETEAVANPTSTSDGTVTGTPGRTATPTATRTPIPPTETPEPSPTPSPTSEIDATDDGTEPVFGRVISDEPINVRSGPGTEFTPVGVLRPGERFEVLGENEDASWINVQLADDTRGWVFAQLVEIELASSWIMPPQIAMNVSDLRGLGMGSRKPAPVMMQPALTLTAGAAATASATVHAESSPAATVSAAGEDRVLDLRVEIPYREERWYGMTLGILAIVVLIVVGNILSLLTRRSVRSARRNR